MRDSEKEASCPSRWLHVLHPWTGLAHQLYARALPSTSLAPHGLCIAPSRSFRPTFFCTKTAAGQHFSRPGLIGSTLFDDLAERHFFPRVREPERDDVCTHVDEMRLGGRASGPPSSQTAPSAHPLATTSSTPSTGGMSSSTCSNGSRPSRQ